MTEDGEKKLEELEVPEQAHIKDEKQTNEFFEDRERDLEMGKIKSDSSEGEHVASDMAIEDSDSSDDVEHPTLTQMASRNSVPASVMSHPVRRSGSDLTKGPTGLKNNSIDDEGRIVVNWASRTDPENPKNWSRRKKVFNVFIISSMTFLCPLCSAMFVRSCFLFWLTCIVVSCITTTHGRFPYNTNASRILCFSLLTRIRNRTSDTRPVKRNIWTEANLCHRLYSIHVNSNS